MILNKRKKQKQQKGDTSRLRIIKLPLPFAFDFFKIYLNFWGSVFILIYNNNKKPKGAKR
jgi:hypothetical protein